MVLGKLDSYMQKNELDQFLIPYTDINSKWMKDLNVRPKNIKLLEENTGRRLFDISYSNIFWICLLRQRKQKQKINKWDLL